MTEKLNNTLKIFLLIFAILFTICSGAPDKTTKNDNKDGDKKDNTTTKLPELPEAVGGKLTKERYKDMPNKKVTKKICLNLLRRFAPQKVQNKMSMFKE